VDELLAGRRVPAEELLVGGGAVEVGAVGRETQEDGIDLAVGGAPIDGLLGGGVPQIDLAIPGRRQPPAISAEGQGVETVVLLGRDVGVQVLAGPDVPQSDGVGPDLGERQPPAVAGQGEDARLLVRESAAGAQARAVEVVDGDASLRPGGGRRLAIRGDDDGDRPPFRVAPRAAHLPRGRVDDAAATPVADNVLADRRERHDDGAGARQIWRRDVLPRGGIPQPGAILAAGRHGAAVGGELGVLDTAVQQPAVAEPGDGPIRQPVAGSVAPRLSQQCGTRDEQEDDGQGNADSHGGPPEGIAGNLRQQMHAEERRASPVLSSLAGGCLL
jgi:hypothetical protein